MMVLSCVLEDGVDLAWITNAFLQVYFGSDLEGRLSLRVSRDKGAIYRPHIRYTAGERIAFDKIEFRGSLVLRLQSR